MTPPKSILGYHDLHNVVDNISLEEILTSNWTREQGGLVSQLEKFLALNISF